jgi:hypothetical protein
VSRCLRKPQQVQLNFGSEFPFLLDLVEFSRNLSQGSDASTSLNYYYFIILFTVIITFKFHYDEYKVYSNLKLEYFAKRSRHYHRKIQQQHNGKYQSYELPLVPQGLSGSHPPLHFLGKLSGSHPPLPFLGKLSGSHPPLPFLGKPLLPFLGKPLLPSSGNSEPHPLLLCLWSVIELTLLFY